MKSNYDEILRDSFSKKIEVPEEYQQRMKETLKQACMASSQKKQYSADKCFQPDSHLENFFQRHKISLKACLSLTAGICACLGFIIVLSIFWKQDDVRRNSNNIQKQYVKISATPAATESTVLADNALRTEIPADTESPQKVKLPLDTTNPTLTITNTHIPEKKQNNDAETAQTKADSNPKNSTKNKHQKNTTAKPKRSKTTHSPELAQVQTSYAPETVERPQQTTTPASAENPERTKTPENDTPQLTSVPKASATPNSGIVFPTAVETPAGTPARASTMPTT